MSSIAAVRAQIAARLLATGALARESTEPIEMIRSESHSPVHLEYAVGSPSQEYTARGKQSITEIEIVIAYHLPPKDRVTGYDAMLTIERTVVASLQTSSWGALNPRLASLTPVRSARQPGPDGWIWLVITFSALHYTL